MERKEEDISNRTSKTFDELQKMWNDKNSWWDRVWRKDFTDTSEQKKIGNAIGSLYSAIDEGLNALKSENMTQCEPAMIGLEDAIMAYKQCVELLSGQSTTAVTQASIKQIVSLCDASNTSLIKAKEEIEKESIGSCKRTIAAFKGLGLALLAVIKIVCALAAMFFLQVFFVQVNVDPYINNTLAHCNRRFNEAYTGKKKEPLELSTLSDKMQRFKDDIKPEGTDETASKFYKK